MLTDQEIAAAPAMAKPYKLYDAKGLLILIQPNGAKWWRLRYRIKGSEKMLSLGVWPEVSLTEARKRRDTALVSVNEGTDPSQTRKARKGRSKDERVATFLAMGEDFLAMKAATWSEQTLSKAKGILNTHVYPKIVTVWEDVGNGELLEHPGSKVAFGDLHVTEIHTPQVFTVLKAIEDKGLIDTAHNAKIRIAQILRSARPRGFKTINVTDDMRGQLQPNVETNHPAITDPKQFGTLLRMIWSYSGRPITRAAFKLAPLVFVRPENLREMEWTEISFDAAEWIIQPEKMKGIRAHKQGLIVPLSTQVIQILTELKTLTGDCRYVLPNERGCIYPLSNGALRVALNRAGYHGIQSWHGFRASARTMLEERLKYDIKFAEMQLGHKVKDSNGTAYNRTAFLDERREMMQRWADYLDALRTEEIEPSRWVATPYPIAEQIAK